MEKDGKAVRGRGAVANPTGRFERLTFEADPRDPADDGEEFTAVQPRTAFYRDSSKSIVTENDSPDIGFRFSVNPYRGCEHGCAYCYARPTHEYLGHSAGMDFETKIYVKERAPELLREKLMSRSWEPEAIFFSGITDCYQPVERKLKLTRRCLEVLAEFKNPGGVITKNALVTRDLDVFRRMHEYRGVFVFLSVTSLDDELAAVLEPRTSRPRARLEAIRRLAEAGIPVGVNVAPVIPGLTDHELPAILKAAAEAGATMAGFTPLRLPLTVAPLFEEWLNVHRPLRAKKVLDLIRMVRGGKLNDANFGSRMRGEGPIADQMRQLFHVHARRLGLNRRDLELSADRFTRPSRAGDQLELF